MGDRNVETTWMGRNREKRRKEINVQKEEIE
jgi:hypothetical protein